MAGAPRPHKAAMTDAAAPLLVLGATSLIGRRLPQVAAGRPSICDVVSCRSEPPGSAPSSARMTRLPVRAAASAAARPAGPAPTTSTSQWAWRLA